MLRSPTRENLQVLSSPYVTAGQASDLTVILPAQSSSALRLRGAPGSRSPHNLFHKGVNQPGSPDACQTPPALRVFAGATVAFSMALVAGLVVMMSLKRAQSDVATDKMAYVPLQRSVLPVASARTAPLEQYSNLTCSREKRVGTGVTFVSSPTTAMREASTQGKLLFLLHVSGNFDDPALT
jgi:hypothetical protein